MDLNHLSRDLTVYVNNSQIKGVGRVDIIIEAEKPLKVQLLRIDTSTTDTVVEEIEPHDAKFANYGKGNMLLLKCSPFKKNIIARADNDADNKSPKQQS